MTFVIREPLPPLTLPFVLLALAVKSVPPPPPPAITFNHIFLVSETFVVLPVPPTIFTTKPLSIVVVIVSLPTDMIFVANTTPPPPPPLLSTPPRRYTFTLTARIYIDVEIKQLYGTVYVFDVDVNVYISYDFDEIPVTPNADGINDEKLFPLFTPFL